MKNLTLMTENQFSFTCPIFEVETRMSHCVRLRDLTYYGGKPLPVRRGCQACIKDSKCPASEIVRRLSFGRDVSDHYGSTKPVKGPIERSVLEKIANVVVTEKTLSHVDASPAERAKIATASERINQMISSAPKKVSTPRSTTPVASKSTINHKVNTAAASGDLAAAINA